MSDFILGYICWKTMILVLLPPLWLKLGIKRPLRFLRMKFLQCWHMWNMQIISYFELFVHIRFCIGLYPLKKDGIDTFTLTRIPEVFTNIRILNWCKIFSLFWYTKISPCLHHLLPKFLTSIRHLSMPSPPEVGAHFARWALTNFSSCTMAKTLNREPYSL